MSYGRAPPRIDGMVSLKVDNLTYRTTPEDLRRVFERCGEVGDIYIPRDRFTRESRGFAFVRFYDKRDAEDALDAMDGVVVDLPAAAGVQGPAHGREVARERGRTPGPSLALDLTPRAREDAPNPRAAPVKDLVQDKMFMAHRMCATPNTSFLYEVFWDLDFRIIQKNPLFFCAFKIVTFYL
ncbi:hypothetical protein GE061_006766 [Apolygus lucorum]|uniref:Serine/arginine-rich splicing factor 2 n=1 Tax=Apolygus lucorum TaxID=248454 RepID=A0A6A4IPM7_APOLU|nr:hypothetical protein GE061_006766 [Apolygus lucorum]